MLKSRIVGKWGRGRGGVLDQLLPFLDVEGGCYAAEVDGAVVAADFAADAAGAELEGDGAVAVEREFDAAALAASFEFPVDIRNVKVRL